MNRPELFEKLLGEFTEDQMNHVDRIIESHKDRAGSLIPVLEGVQAVTGYLPDLLQQWVALGIRIPQARIFGVVTFYSFFTQTPKGKHQIKVCLGTACYVRGSEKIVNRIGKELDIHDGEVTEDRKFSLDTLRCVGACGLAPVMIVGEDTYGKVKLEGIKNILEEY